MNELNERTGEKLYREYREWAEATAKKLIAEQRLNHEASRIISAVYDLVEHYPSIPGLAGWLEEADRFLVESDPDRREATPAETTGAVPGSVSVPIAWERMTNEAIVELIDRADKVIGERECPHCRKPLFCWLGLGNCQRCGKVVCLECHIAINGEVNGTGLVQHYCPECHPVVMEEIAARAVAEAASRVVEKAEEGAAELAASAEWDAEITAQAEIDRDRASGKVVEDE